MDHTCESKGATTKAAEKAEWEKGRDRKKEREIRCNESALHLVLHLPPNASATASPAATASATMRLQ